MFHVYSPRPNSGKIGVIWSLATVCLCFIEHVTSTGTPVELKLGFTWPLSADDPGKYAWAGQAWTVESVLNIINERGDILPNTHISVVSKDSYVAGAPKSLAGTQGRAIAAAYEVSTEGVFAVVGDASSYTAPYATLVTSGFKIPSCIPMAGADELSNKLKYPYSIRMIQPNYVWGRKLMNFAAHYNWRKIAFVHSAGEYGSSYISSVRDGARLNNITIILDQAFNLGVGGDRDYRQPVQNLAASGARVFVVTGLMDEVTNFYVEAAKQNLTGPDYVWITDGGLRQRILEEELEEEEVKNAAAFWIDTKPVDREGEPFLELEEACETYFPNTPELPTRVEDCTYDTGVADCIWALAWGFDKYLKEHNLDADVLVNPDYLGDDLPPIDLSVFNNSKPAIHGEAFIFDANGDYYYQIVQYYDREIDEFYDYEVAELDEHWNVHDIYEEGKKVQAIFFGGSTVIPPDFAPSVAQNPTWNSAIGALIATLSLLCTTFGLGSVIVVFIYRNEGVIKKASWKSLLLIALGTCLVSASPLLYIGSLDRAMCIGQPFLLNVGFGLTFSNLLAKTWRVYKIFSNPKKMSMAIDDARLLQFSTGIVMVELMLCIVWITYDTPRITAVAMTEVKHMLVCQSSSASFQNAMTAASMAFNGMLLLMATWLSYQTRHVRAEWNESRWIGISVYNIVAVSALFLPLVYNVDFIGYSFVLRSLGALLGVVVLQICTLGIKFVHLVKPTAAEPESFPSAINSKNGRLFGTGSAGSPIKTAPLQAENQQLMRVGKVPVLERSVGRFMSLTFTFFARWKRAEVIVFPGFLCLDFLVENGAAPRFKSFRTSGASVFLAADSNATEGGNADLVNMTIITKDGTLELLLDPTIATELRNRISPPVTTDGAPESLPRTARR
ncbi:hypothetical protein HDU85_001080 [Gaertneriomyces sp. JEL0708]|nr:hypothetical protein HDU85_001080 [Gaertneriomyces sp. JEL0708]